MVVMDFDSIYKVIMEMSDFDKESLPRGLVFFLPVEDRPSELPPLPEEMADSKFWHVGIIYKSQAYETFNHARNSVSDADSRISHRSFKNIVFTSYPINTARMLSEIDSGTDCATYVGRVLGMSDTVGYEKDPKIWPDTIFEKLKTDGVRFHRGVKELKDRRQMS